MADGLHRPVYSHIGRKIARARKSAGCTQCLVGHALGLTQQQISNIERGRSVPTLAQLHRFARLFGVKPRDLFPVEWLEC